ncbi:MAG TPA: hypothetical protein VHJ69_01900 [Gemmatimonadales bacterium]|nr:hypothetical protein [Gemmatimonadales bacterium]
MRSAVIGVAMAIATAPPLAAQVDSVIRVSVNAPKPNAIERTMRAFINAGLTVTDVDRAGLVKATGHEKGDVTVTYTAAVLPHLADDSICDVTLSAFARYQPFAQPVNPLGAQVNAKTKGGAAVWARLESIAKSLGVRQTKKAS